MANDPTKYVRRVAIVAMKADAAIAATVGARVYPPQRPANPIWPFVAWGVDDNAPFEASGMDGNEIDARVHAFADSHDGASDLAAAVVRALVGAGPLDLTGEGCPYPAIAHFTWQRTQVIQDGDETDSFHAIAFFRVAVVS